MKSMAISIVKTLIKATLLKIIMQSMGMGGASVSAISAGQMGNIAPSAGSVGYAGVFAKGGRIPPNSLAIVGDDGMEMVRTGSQAAHVTPNNQLGGSKIVNINTTVNANGNSNADQISSRTVKAIKNMVQQEIGESTRPGNQLNRTQNWR